MIDMEEQLYNLQMVCNRYKETDILADWVLFAIARYINTGRSTRQFERAFCDLNNEDLIGLVKYCLNRGKSDIEILSSAKKYMGVYGLIRMED